MNKLSPSAFVALSVHISSFVLMLLRVEPFYTFFYSLAWWSFIFFLAVVNRRIGANSRVLGSPSAFLGIALLSIGVWLLFEAYNLRLGNWHYVGVPVERALRWPGYFVAFATVLPGILEAERLLWNLGIWKGTDGRPVRVSRPLLIRFMVIGVLMMIAPLLRPDLFFPLPWVGLIFLLDPIIYLSRNKDRSLIGKAQRGHYGRTLRLLLAGFLCGFLWEFWNYWAGSKWIYSIPHFDYLRIFEMPFLGYFGFPFFAIECYLVYQVFLLLRQKKVFQSPLALTVWLVLGFFCAAVVVFAIDRSTVVTYKLLL